MARAELTVQVFSSPASGANDPTPLDWPLPAPTLQASSAGPERVAQNCSCSGSECQASQELGGFLSILPRLEIAA
jgi:hypothetical protein